MTHNQQLLLYWNTNLHRRLDKNWRNSIFYTETLQESKSYSEASKTKWLQLTCRKFQPG